MCGVCIMRSRWFLVGCFRTKCSLALVNLLRFPCRQRVVSSSTSCVAACRACISWATTTTSKQLLSAILAFRERVNRLWRSSGKVHDELCASRRLLLVEVCVRPSAHKTQRLLQLRNSCKKWGCVCVARGSQRTRKDGQKNRCIRVFDEKDSVFLMKKEKTVFINVMSATSEGSNLSLNLISGSPKK